LPFGFAFVGAGGVLPVCRQVITDDDGLIAFFGFNPPHAVHSFVTFAVDVLPVPVLIYSPPNAIGERD
jgi:hypothetical protein